MVATQLVTAADLLARPKEGRRHELVAGELREMPMGGGEHGQIETEFVYRLRDHLHHRRLGRVFPGDAGFFFSRDPEIVLFPAVAVVRLERLPPPSQRTGYVDVIPDLVVEIVSPSERPGAIAAKIRFYLERGVGLVWVAYPARREIVAHRPGRQPQTFAATADLVAGDLLPDFRVPVADFFQ